VGDLHKNNKVGAQFVFETVRRHWYVVVALALIGAVAGILSARFVEPIYRSEAVLAPVQTDRANALGGLTGQLGSLAALAGVQLPQGTDASVAVETLRSRELAITLIESRALMPLLFSSEWDSAARRWKDRAPTLNEALRLFDRRIRSVRQDAKTGMVRLAIEWKDPAEAAAWANLLVTQANLALRQREIAEATQTIEELTAEVEKTSSLEVRTALYRLIEAQLKTKAVASGREQFAFRVIDRAMVQDLGQPIWPRRSVLGAFGLVLGGIGGLLGALLISWRRGRGALWATQ